jgi:hypothetical protein
MRIIVTTLIYLAFFAGARYNLHQGAGHIKSNLAVDDIPASAQKLVKSYPGFVVGFADNQLIFKDGSKMLWDDGIKNKPTDATLEKPDLKDMFIQKYKTGAMNHPPAKDFDPGRVRNEAFFMKMYGSTEKEVQKNLTDITWCPKLIGQKITVTKINGVDKRLIAISKELDEHPELKKYVTNIGGTFTWRNISGTDRHSMHSFGMTIDINTKYSDYWQWACKCKSENADAKYTNRIPQLIVTIFERNGFIWGGKWYHFDTMHFEYRPELID